MSCDRILAAKARDAVADLSAVARRQAGVNAWERDHRDCGTGIDQLVYALYGLTPEEIKIVKETGK